MLRIAIQKSGRLSERSLDLFKECGISVPGTRDGNRLRCVASNYPLEILFLRDDDIPGYVQDGTADLGIVGHNILVESEFSGDSLEELGFSHCRLSFAVPRGSTIKDYTGLEGLRIATSYPVSVRAFLKKKGIKAEVHTISGSVEVAPGIGLADAICDLVSSGSTLVSNGLRELDCVLHSQAMLVGTKGLSSSDKASNLEKLLFRIRAVKRATGMKYVVLNAPRNSLETIVSLLPGIKSPTVVPLADPKWTAVHSLVNEDQFWEVLESLKTAGAEGILVLSVEKLIQ